MEPEESGETTKGGQPGPASSFVTLQKAVDLGEYDPEYLSGFAEWHALGKHAKLQLIRQGLDNREKQLIVQWAEITNVMDFSKKPELQEALRNIEKQREKLGSDRERLYIEYSRP